jgi:fluoride exporter
VIERSQVTEHPGAPALLAAVALGGSVGATARHLCTVAVPDSTGFPWTTFAINVAGSFLLALLLHRKRPIGPLAHALLGPGLLGGFTTLSTYSEHTRVLLADGQAAIAAAYAGGTLVACLAAVALARRLPGPVPAESRGRR